jgi:hypothetical protein
MAEEALQGRQGDALLHCCHREGMAQHVRGHRPANSGMVGHAFDQQLDGAGCQTDRLMEREVVRDERLETSRERDDAPLRATAVWAGPPLP